MEFPNNPLIKIYLMDSQHHTGEKGVGNVLHYLITVVQINLVMRWLDGSTDSMDMDLGELQETVRNREAWWATVPEVSELDMT